MFISATQNVTCHVNFMQNMKLTASDVRKCYSRFLFKCQSCKMHAQGEINTHVRTINREVA